MKYIQIVFSLIVFGTLLTGCYRMPAEDEYSVVPTTNNPNVTNQKKVDHVLPDMGY